MVGPVKAAHPKVVLEVVVAELEFGVASPVRLRPALDGEKCASLEHFGCGSWRWEGPLSIHAYCEGKVLLEGVYKEFPEGVRPLEELLHQTVGREAHLSVLLPQVDHEQLMGSTDTRLGPPTAQTDRRGVAPARGPWEEATTLGMG